MAKVLGSFDFQQSESKTKYPWHKWSDGQIWELVEGEDYLVSYGSMRSMIHMRAKRDSRSVRVNATGPGLVLQFYDRATGEDN